MLNTGSNYEVLQHNLLLHSLQTLTPTPHTHTHIYTQSVCDTVFNNKHSLFLWINDTFGKGHSDCVWYCCAPVAKLVKRVRLGCLHYQWVHQSWPIKPACPIQFKICVLHIRNGSVVIKSADWHFLKENLCFCLAVAASPPGTYSTPQTFCLRQKMSVFGSPGYMFEPEEFPLKDNDSYKKHMFAYVYFAYLSSLCSWIS